MHTQTDIESIQKIVGPATEEQIRFIDSYVCDDIGIFLPIAGPCFYSLTPEHTHPSYMIIYSFKEEDTGWVNSKFQSPIKPGEFLFMSPDIKHQENEGSETPKYIAVFIRPELFEPIAEEYNISIDLLRNTTITIKAQKQFLPLCWQFIAEAQPLHSRNESLLNAIAIQLCHSIIRTTFPTSKQTSKTEWRTEIGQSIAFIHSHLHEKIELAQIAQVANMSVPNFSRVFKKEMYISPIEYVSEQRLYKAQNMLLANEFSMKDIAHSCGYSSLSYFSTTFRKKHKLSPEQYRQRMTTQV